jgi:hypothetical protein
MHCDWKTKPEYVTIWELTRQDTKPRLVSQNVILQHLMQCARIEIIFQITCLLSLQHNEKPIVAITVTIASEICDSCKPRLNAWRTETETRPRYQTWGHHRIILNSAGPCEIQEF